MIDTSCSGVSRWVVNRQLCTYDVEDRLWSQVTGDRNQTSYWRCGKTYRPDQGHLLLTPRIGWEGVSGSSSPVVTGRASDWVTVSSGTTTPRQVQRFVPKVPLFHGETSCRPKWGRYYIWMERLDTFVGVVSLWVVVAPYPLGFSDWPNLPGSVLCSRHVYI